MGRVRDRDRSLLIDLGVTVGARVWDRVMVMVMIMVRTMDWIIQDAPQ